MLYTIIAGVAGIVAGFATGFLIFRNNSNKLLAKEAEARAIIVNKTTGVQTKLLQIRSLFNI